MKWIGITGSWRTTNKQVENDVRREVAETIKSGDGIVSGGALGVDFIATDEAIKLNPECSQIKIILPSSYKTYKNHYLKSASEGVITKAQANKLIKQLSKLNDKKALIEGSAKEVTYDAYNDRSAEVVNYSDELLAFHVNNSRGVQYTIDRAKGKGIPIKRYKYSRTKLHNSNLGKAGLKINL